MSYADRTLRLGGSPDLWIRSFLKSGRCELAALTAAQISPEARAVAVDRKVIEVRGRLYLEAPKNRKWRQAVYPSLTPHGWPLAEMVAARIADVGAEQDAGTNPLGLMFPAPAGGYWRSSNFRRRVLEGG